MLQHFGDAHFVLFVGSDLKTCKALIVDVALTNTELASAANGEVCCLGETLKLPLHLFIAEESWNIRTFFR